MTSLMDIANTELAIIENESEFITERVHVEVEDDDSATLIVYGTICAFNASIRIVVTSRSPGVVDVKAHMKYDIEGGWWEEI